MDLEFGRGDGIQRLVDKGKILALISNAAKYLIRKLMEMTKI